MAQAEGRWRRRRRESETAGSDGPSPPNAARAGFRPAPGKSCSWPGKRACGCGPRIVGMAASSRSPPKRKARHRPRAAAVQCGMPQTTRLTSPGWPGRGTRRAALPQSMAASGRRRAGPRRGLLDLNVTGRRRHHPHMSGPLGGGPERPCRATGMRGTRSPADTFFPERRRDAAVGGRHRLRASAPGGEVLAVTGDSQLAAGPGETGKQGGRRKMRHQQ